MNVGKDSQYLKLFTPTGSLHTEIELLKNLSLHKPSCRMDYTAFRPYQCGTYLGLISSELI